MNRTSITAEEQQHAHSLNLTEGQYLDALNAEPIDETLGRWGIQIEVDSTGDDARPWATSVWIYRIKDGEGGSLECGETYDGDAFPKGVCQRAERLLAASPMDRLY